jgi:predicted MPP superfamily phosphohydrolase
MKNELVMTIPAVILLAGLPWKIDVFEETITSGKITKPLKICVLADLHCRRFGKKQGRITKIVDAYQPDIIVIPGDLFDYGRDYEISFELLKAIKKYPVFFPAGIMKCSWRKTWQTCAGE